MPSLDELLQVVIDAKPDEWCTVENFTCPEPDHDFTRVVFTPDVNVSVVYFVEDFSDDFTMPGLNFPDPRIHRVWLDILFMGTLVYRVAQLGVDGLRAVLPDPRNVLSPDGVGEAAYEIVGYTVTQREVDLARVTDMFFRGQIERYLADSAIVVVG